ncbi:sensor histidine kinase [Hyalangium versicolor]|uniref:sensor histidine kinase n=1 Tax=Hyalangium versicolor TaxID=2861190 RepID=UPI001CCF25E9|nr:hybrid sensor histidine kinase/response regulator [Hyalangium versicolor]
MTRQRVRLLLVEDSSDDEVLLMHELRDFGFDVSHIRVATREEFLRALEAGPWDAIISDYMLPGFNGLTAFSSVKQRGLDVPFLIVSGVIGEETAVEAMKAGVHDFLLKDKLGRLGPALTRELRESAVRAERRSMQEQLLLSDRLASLGMLAAGVAHEINNPLTSLIMNLDHALNAVPEQQLSLEGEQALRNAFECSLHIRQIVRDIKVFSRPGEQRLGPVELHEVLDSVLRMAWHQVFHRARLVKEYGQNMLAVGNEARLAQVFLNLVINAAQAIPEGRSSTHEIRVVTRLEGADAVRVEIHDTGPGIPLELQERIFEPFFTTKDSGVGTGLGLAICRRVVSEMGGRIGVKSQPGQGSTFWVHLRAAQSALDADAAPRTSLSGSEA